MARSDKVQEELKPSGPGPGDRLQAARIAMDLSIEDVANRMHLSKMILEALEENNFDEITAPIFVKGYLRAYARMVSLDETEVIQQYVEYYSGEDPPISATSNMVPEISANDARIRWTTYLVIMVLLVSLGIWWWNKTESPVDPVSLDSGQSDIGVESSVSETPIAEPAIEAESESIDHVESIAETDGAEQIVVETEEVVAESVPVVDDGTSSQSFDSSTEVSIEAPTAITSVDVVADEVVAELSTEPATPVESVAPDQLKISVHADTWADIKDVNGERLVYNLLRAEQVIEVSGEPPYSVFFGNGHGVEVFFNGEPVDVAGRTKDDNTARLKVGTN